MIVVVVEKMAVKYIYSYMKSFMKKYIFYESCLYVIDLECMSLTLSLKDFLK